MAQQYGMPDDKYKPGPCKMMSDIDYFEGTERVRVTIHNKNENVLKLKCDMIPYSVRKEIKRYERCRFVHQLIGVFRNKYQEADVISKSVNK